MLLYSNNDDFDTKVVSLLSARPSSATPQTGAIIMNENKITNWCATASHVSGHHKWKHKWKQSVRYVMIDTIVTMQK